MGKSCCSVACLLAALLPQLSWAQDSIDLARRAFLGVRVSALTETQLEHADSGLNIVSVFPNSTASEYGFEPGQIILEANGQPLVAANDLPNALAGLRSGANVEFVLLSDEVEQTVDAQLRAFPAEQYDQASVLYHALGTVNGTQRSILTRPDGNSAAPVVYILQGFDCSSIDMALNSDSSMGKLVEHLNSMGFATYRVEKTGRGDSIGSSCLDVGFEAESQGFIAGLQQLKQLQGIDADRIYLLGISLGGIWAPMLAQQEQIAGIISFGTIAKTWQEYMSDNWRRQWNLAGKSASATDRDLKLANLFWYQLVEEELPPTQIFQQFPQTASLATAVGYEPGGELLFGRHYSFTRELAATNIMSYWESVTSPTLVLWGRGDYVASESDQLLIYNTLRKNEVDVDIRYLEVDHYWREAADFETSYRGLRVGDRAEISESVYTTILEWLEQTG